MASFPSSPILAAVGPDAGNGLILRQDDEPCAKTVSVHPEDRRTARSHDAIGPMASEKAVKSWLNRQRIHRNQEAPTPAVLCELNDVDGRPSKESQEGEETGG